MFESNPDSNITGCVNLIEIQSPTFDQVAVSGMFQQQMQTQHANQASESINTHSFYATEPISSY